MKSALFRSLWPTNWINKTLCVVSRFPALSDSLRYRFGPDRQRNLFHYSSSTGSTETSHPSYRYAGLPGPRWIRVLEIPASRESHQPADSGAPLICCLVNASLDNDKQYYDALSYSWDGQVHDRFLHLQDETDGALRQLLVTKNCEHAIRALQPHMSPEPLRIWIDAISIDQKNVKERNNQVSMMRDIYERAHIVRVWLGPEMHDSYAALRGLLHLWSRKSKNAGQALELALSGGIHNLTRRPYWQPMWTLQEVAVEKIVQFHVGNQRGHYFSLANGSLNSDDDQHFFRMDIHFYFGAKVRNELKDDCVPHRLVTLMLAQSKHSSKPKDKIYAVRSLMPDMFKNIVVDYGKTVQQVLTDGTRAVIEHTNSLEVLFFQIPTEHTTTMPSWAVDWSKTKGITNLIMQASIPSESTTAPENIAFSDEYQVLNLHGRVIDTVEYVSWSLSRKFDPELELSKMRMRTYLVSLDGAKDIFAIRLWIMVASGALHGQVPIDQIIAQFAKTLGVKSAEHDDFIAWLQLVACQIPLIGCSMETLDATWKSKLTPKRETTVRRALFPALKGPLVDVGIIHKILMLIFLDMSGDKRMIQQHFNIIRRLGGRRFFLTSAGRMGIGDEHMKKFDRIMVFEGSNFPMVVRSDGIKNVFVGPAKVPSLDVDALLGDKHVLEEVRIS